MLGVEAPAFRKQKLLARVEAVSQCLLNASAIAFSASGAITA